MADSFNTSAPKYSKATVGIGSATAAALVVIGYMTITSYISFDPIATPTTPPSGKVLLYAKNDSKLYTKDSAGTETEVGAGGGAGGDSLPVSGTGTQGDPFIIGNGATETGADATHFFTGDATGLMFTLGPVGFASGLTDYYGSGVSTFDAPYFINSNVSIEFKFDGKDGESLYQFTNTSARMKRKTYFDGVVEVNDMLNFSITDGADDSDVGIYRVNPNTVKVIGGVTGTNGGEGWLINAGGRSCITTPVTNNDSSTLTEFGKWFGVVTGQTYSFQIILMCENSVPADGIKIDLYGGGSATASHHAFMAEAFDTGASVLHATADAEVLEFDNITGITKIVIHGSFTCVDPGYIKPRFARNSDSSGTVTIFAGSYVWIEPMP